MSFLDRVCVLILTFNEAPNIERTLAQLKTFPEVLVLDSGSTDETLAIARSHSNVRVASRPFDTHGAQWNHGLRACGIGREWVLALDADYVLTPALVQEIAALSPPVDAGGYRTRFRYCVQGQELSGSLYPPVVTLFRRTQAAYVQDGHTQRIVVAGRVLDLNESIRHDDRKPLARWLISQQGYAELECRLLLGGRWSELSWRDRLRRMIVITPWLVPLYCLTAGRGALDGKAGLYYALQRGVAEAILSLKLVEAQWLRASSGSDS